MESFTKFRKLAGPRLFGLIFWVPALSVSPYIKFPNILETENDVSIFEKHEDYQRTTVADWNHFSNIINQHLCLDKTPPHYGTVKRHGVKIYMDNNTRTILSVWVICDLTVRQKQFRNKELTCLFVLSNLRCWQWCSEFVQSLNY